MVKKSPTKLLVQSPKFAVIIFFANRLFCVLIYTCCVLKKLANIKNQITNNRQFIIPTKKNIVNFLASLESVMTYDGYKSIFDSARELLIYAQDRFERCELSLLGYKCQNPWNDQENIPIDIKNIADSLQIRDIEQDQKEIC